MWNSIIYAIIAIVIIASMTFTNSSKVFTPDGVYAPKVVEENRKIEYDNVVGKTQQKVESTILANTVANAAVNSVKTVNPPTANGMSFIWGFSEMENGQSKVNKSLLTLRDAGSTVKRVYPKKMFKEEKVEAEDGSIKEGLNLSELVNNSTSPFLRVESEKGTAISLSLQKFSLTLVPSKDVLTDFIVTDKVSGKIMYEYYYNTYSPEENIIKYIKHDSGDTPVKDLENTISAKVEFTLDKKEYVMYIIGIQAGGTEKNIRDVQRLDMNNYASRGVVLNSLATNLTNSSIIGYTADKYMYIKILAISDGTQQRILSDKEIFELFSF